MLSVGLFFHQSADGKFLTYALVCCGFAALLGKKIVPTYNLKEFIHERENAPLKAILGLWGCKQICADSIKVKS